MPTATHKQRVLTRLLTPRKGDAAEPEARPVLEQLLYSVCREGTTREKADRAFRKLQTSFFDWNEIRVSAVREIEEVLGDLSDTESRAVRIISLLQEVFETTYSFDLESLHKKGLKQAQKQLERYQGSTPYSVAYTLQMGLGGHALPMDGDMMRTLRRMDVLENEADEAAIAGLEHLVPKARGPQFCEIVNTLAQDYCLSETPKCGSCPMHDVCPTGHANTQRRATAERATTKSRARS